MRRFLIFNVVGAIGFVVQLGVLALLLHAGVHYLAATALAVEAAILQNFVWHERWTWRARGVEAGPRWPRLWRFHALNGVVSLAGNGAVMALLVGVFGAPPIPANAAAVLACSLVNFAAGDALVWKAS